MFDKIADAIKNVGKVEFEEYLPFNNFANDPPEGTKKFRADPAKAVFIKSEVYFKSIEYNEPNTYRVLTGLEEYRDKKWQSYPSVMMVGVFRNDTFEKNIMAFFSLDKKTDEPRLYHTEEQDRGLMKGAAENKILTAIKMMKEELFDDQM